MLGGKFFFGKKVDDNADFAKYDKVFCKNTFFKKKCLFIISYNVVVFMRGLQFLSFFRCKIT